MAEHRKSQCRRRVVLCEHCKQSIIAERLPAHQRVCPATRTACPHCATERQRRLQDAHLAECPEAPVECPLAQYGCSADSLVRRQLPKHMRQADVGHLQQVLKRMEVLEAQRVRLEGQVEELCGQVLLLTKRVSNAHSSTSSSSRSSRPNRPRGGAGPRVRHRQERRQNKRLRRTATALPTVST